jgi:hypothetical protein
MKALQRTLLVLSLFALVQAPAVAAGSAGGPNDFFGTSLGGVENSPASTAANAAAQAAANAGSGADLSSDEKRMQKKYRENVRYAEKLVAKGTAMMRSSNDKESKKGKIFKEIGERRLAELKANNPLPEVAERPDKAATVH